MCESVVGIGATLSPCDKDCREYCTTPCANEGCEMCPETATFRGVEVPVTDPQPAKRELCRAPAGTYDGLAAGRPYCPTPCPHGQPLPFGGSLEPIVEEAGDQGWPTGDLGFFEGAAAMAAATEIRRVSETGGEKGEKAAKLGGADPLALEQLALIYGFGEAKYSRFNYLKGYPWSLSIDAMYRHFLAFQAGEDLDPESGLPHMAHAAWHALALTSFGLRQIGTDDRPPRK